MINNISLKEAENIAQYVYGHLKAYLRGRIRIKLINTDKFGFTLDENIPVLFLEFKIPQHGADFFREFMIPLSLNHEAQVDNLSKFTIRLEITHAHPLILDHAQVNILFENFKKSIKEGYIPHPRI